MRVLTLISLAFLPSLLCAQPSRDLMLAVQQAKIQSLEQSAMPVGSVIQSFLSLEQFSKLTTGNWVPCDGKEYPKSIWAEVTGSAKIPDCRGLFLRSTGGSAAPLAKPQTQDTAANGLKVVEGGSHAHSWEEEKNLFCGDRPLFSPYKAVHAYSDRACFPEGAGTMNHNTGVSGTHGHSLTGGSETRPDNISVNVFIRIN